MELHPSQSHPDIDSLPRSQPDWRYRIHSRLSHPRLVNLMLKLFSANRLSEGVRARWQVSGIPYADLEAVLPTIRTMDDWWCNWRIRAEQCEAEANAAFAAGRRAEAVEKYLQAYALYNISTQGLYVHPKRLTEVTRKMADCYARAAPYLNPPAQRVEVPFDGAKLPGYLRIPSYAPGSLSRILSLSRTKKQQTPSKYPLVMLSNGAGNVKEEMRVMEEHLLVHGIATLSVDGPGVGETWAQMGWMAEQERVAEAKLKFLASVPQVELNRVGLFGLSLGGWSALRSASHLHRFKAVAAVCPPYDGPAYFDEVPHHVRETVKHMSRAREEVIEAALPSLTLRGHIQNIRCPIMIVGAGRDSIVPGIDSQLIIEEATCEKELLWYPYDEHCAPQHLSEWQSKVAAWMAKQLVK